MSRATRQPLTLKPSIKFLRTCDSFLLTPDAVARLLEVPPQRVAELVREGRIPAPLSVGGISRPRWSWFELTRWVAAGCPASTRVRGGGNAT